jgi:DNA-binding LacI/PurR family transcriptional regulator
MRTDIRPPTIRDVARLAGVSTATVSRILSGAAEARPDTQARVLAAVHELDYRPSGIARSLKMGSTRTIGLIVTDILNPFYPELVRAIEDAARARDLAIMLCNGQEDADREATYLELLSERRVDGIIVASGSLSERHGQWLRSAPVPVVLVNCRIAGDSQPAALTDNNAAARLATEHLLALGHRRLGHITGRPTDAATDDRLAGVRAAISSAEMPPGALVVVEGDGHVTGGVRGMAELLAAPGVTGVVCYNDLTAIGALRAIRDRGLNVPEDVSVVGFDDIDLAMLVDPPLTTIAQDTESMGRWAVEHLVEILGGGHGQPSHDAAPQPDAGVLLLPGRLRVRGTSGPAPA